jgi:hypothetical protein
MLSFRKNSLNPLPKNEISQIAGNEKSQRVLDCLRCNDPSLKELTLGKCWSSISIVTMIIYAFKAMATNSSLEILNIEFKPDFLGSHELKEMVMRALSLNTSLKEIRVIRTTSLDWKIEVFDILKACPHLEALTIENVYFQAETITYSMAPVLLAVTKLHLQSLTIESFRMDSDHSAAFAAAFQGNHTIKTLIMKGRAISLPGAVSFAEALPHDHSLETIVIDEPSFDDDSVVSIIRNLCRTPLKVLSLAGSWDKITQEGCERIVQTLKENEHCFVKLDLFRDSQDSPWHNFTQLEIDKLTWNNHLQVEKNTWIDPFLGQDAPTKELLFLALERAKKVDNEQFSKAPDMLFYLIKELPDLIAQAIRDRD